jgi:hypothetical protein
VKQLWCIPLSKSIPQHFPDRPSFESLHVLQPVSCLSDTEVNVPKGIDDWPGWSP